MKGKLFLSGGGSEELSKSIDSEWKKSLLPKPKVLFVPFARHPEKYDKTFEWFKKAYSFIDFGEVKLLDKPNQLTKEEILSFDALYVGGGNTFRLLRIIKESGFDKIIFAFHESGKPIYGGSAGAIILGKSIKTSSILDEKEEVDPAGLNLLQNHSVAVHYLESQNEKLQEFDENIICIPEDAGVVVEGEKIKIVGNTCKILNRNKLEMLSVGEFFLKNE